MNMGLDDLKLFVALPSYDGSRFNGVALMHMARQVPNAVPVEVASSLLPLTFNTLLCMARNGAAQGLFTHFLMLHADVVPRDPDWFGKFWEQYEFFQAQMLAAIIPVKDERGLTSTGVETAGDGRVRRLTMREVLDRQGTFTHPCILLNTGMLLFGLEEPWVKDVSFRLQDSIEMLNGQAAPRSTGEDWDFSRQARAAGCIRQYATRAVALHHVGQQRYPNDQAWGLDHDDGGTA